ncbi:MAG: DUF1289 domain-containing protein [Mangrovicoccus sp.]
MTQNAQPIASPCIKICVIEPQSRLCTGCLRSLDEIAAWSGYSEAQRAEIMAELPARESQLTRRQGGRKGRLARQSGTSSEHS